MTHVNCIALSNSSPKPAEKRPALDRRGFLATAAGLAATAATMKAPCGDCSAIRQTAAPTLQTPRPRSPQPYPDPERRRR